MNTYHETTGELLESPDLALGRTYSGRRFIAHHEAVDAQYGTRIMPDTEALNGGKGYKERYLISPAQPAWDEYEDCYFYHEYTAEELEAMKPPDPEPEVDLTGLATWDELSIAFTEGVNSI